MLFIPLRDENRTRRPPLVNYGLIGLNVAVFLYTWPLIHGGAVWLAPGYGLVPTRISADPTGEAFTVLTSMFMHASLEHLGFNMLFLHVFGDILEDVMGRARYLAFYLVSGLVAAIAQVSIDVLSPIPVIGASGAISGVVGGYLLLFPRSPIVMLNLFPPLIFLIGLLPVLPAWSVGVLYYALDLLRVLFGLDTRSSGVAVAAHLGGFAAGLLLVNAFVRARPSDPQRSWRGFRSSARPGPGPAGARWRRRPRKPE